MTPILRRSAFALLAVFWSAPAFPCRFCAAPTQSPPEQLAPQAPFDVRTLPGFLPGELDYVLKAESGRYSPKLFYFVDAKAASPDSHLATTARVQALFKTRAEGLVADLRGKLAAGRITEADSKDALLLFWYRGPLLGEGDRKFLESLNPLGLGKAPSLVGEAKRPPAALAAGPGQADGNLMQRFLGQVELSGTPQETSALRDAAAMLLATPTGRELAGEFIQAGGRARVSFTAYPNSGVVETNGKKVLFGLAGTADSTKAAVEVQLNRMLLQTDPEYRRRSLVIFLGHELLGHGLEGFRAKNAGVFSTYYRHYRDNEGNARVVGWLVEAELGGKIHDWELYAYLKDPDEFHKSLQTRQAYYSTLFSREEGGQAPSVLQARLAAARQALADVPKDIASWESWRPVVEHFIAVHKTARESFSSIIQDIDNSSKTSLPAHAETLKGIIRYLEATNSDYSGITGAVRVKALERDLQNDFFTGEEARLERLTGRLEAAVKGRSYEPFAPVPAGKVTWDQLKEMRSSDKRKNPGHWGAPKK